MGVVIVLVLRSLCGRDTEDVSYGQLAKYEALLGVMTYHLECLFFSRSFGGYHMESFTPWLKEAEKLSGFLKNTTYSYITDYYYIGGYDSPFKFLDRHNEVWFIAK